MQLDERRRTLLINANNDLILHLDAINNTGEGHGDKIKYWKDLSSNNNDFTWARGTVAWTGNSYHCTGDAGNVGVVKCEKQLLKDVDEFTILIAKKTNTGASTKGKTAFSNATIRSPTNGFIFTIAGKDNSKDVFYASSDDGQSIQHAAGKGTSGRFNVHTFRYQKRSGIYYAEIFNNDEKVGGSWGAKMTLNTLKSSQLYAIGSAYSYEGGGTYAYAGEIYSIKIFNRALSDDEISEEYQKLKNRFNNGETTESM